MHLKRHNRAVASRRERPVRNFIAFLVLLLMSSLLQIEKLVITLHGRAVVDGASLSLQRGEIAALVGESGSGKTLLTRSLIRLLPSAAECTARTLSFDGIDVLALDPDGLRSLRGPRIGFVFQEPLSSLNPSVRIGIQLTEGLLSHTDLTRSQARARALDMLERVQIRDPHDCLQRYPHELSGGMRQRAMIAAALAMKPALLVADEPTTALDALVQRRVLEVMRDAAVSLGSAMLIVTHDLSMVRGLAQTIHVMECGRIVESGATAQVLTRPVHEYTQKLVRAMTSALPRSAFSGSAEEKERLRVEGACVNFTRDSSWFSSKRTSGVSALTDVSFELRPGEILAMVGESGSGKSTLGRAIAGLQPLASGCITLGGRDLRTIPPAQRRIQYMFQDPWSALDPRMRVRDIVGEGLLFQRHVSFEERERRVRAALAQVALPEQLYNRYPHELSGGQRQRVNIARAIVVEPRFVVADEPVSALDLTVQRQIMELLLELRQALGFGCLFVSHDLAAVGRMADRIGVLYRGRLVELGARDEVFERPRHPYTCELLSSLLDPPVPGEAGEQGAARLASATQVR